MPSRVGADDAGGGGGVGEIVEVSGGVREGAVPPGNRSAARKTARFAEPVSALRAGADDDDDGYGDSVEITIDVRDNRLAVHSVKAIAGGEDSEETLESSHGRGVLQNASARIKQVSQELRRLTSLSRRGWIGDPSSVDRSAPEHALEGLKFISKTDGSAGWTWKDVERCFKEEAEDGLLLDRFKFAKCIGMKEQAGDVAFAGALFDALARRRNISGDSINMEELRVFWKQISDTSFDSRLGIFFDMVDKDANGVIDKEVKDIIMLSASANNLTMVANKSEEYARLIMEELDPKKRGYIDVINNDAIFL